jgi:exodeoxyribonuclease-1
MFVKQEALEEGVTRLPIKTIHVNKSPIVIGNLKTLSPAMAERWGLDLAQGLRHAETLAREGQLLAGLWGEVFQRPVAAGPVDVDEDLYGGFLSPDDRRLLNRLRGLDAEALAERVAQGKAAFQDARLTELLFRYRARNFPASLSDAEQAQWQAHCAARLHEGAGGAQTLAQFFERIDALGESAEDERSEAILGALYDYAEQIAPPPP